MIHQSGLVYRLGEAIWLLILANQNSSVRITALRISSTAALVQEVRVKKYTFISF